MVVDGHALENHCPVAKLEDVENGIQTNQPVSVFELHAPPDLQHSGPVPLYLIRRLTDRQ